MTHGTRSLNPHFCQTGLREGGSIGGKAAGRAQLHRFTSIHTLFTSIHTLFAHYSQLFAHYSRTIRALFAHYSRRFTSVHVGSRRFAPVHASSSLVRTVSDYVRTICAIRRYSHYSRGIRTIRAVFARYSHSIRTHSHMFAPRSHLGRTLFATIRNHSRRVASVNICECVIEPPSLSHSGPGSLTHMTELN